MKYVKEACFIQYTTKHDVLNHLINHHGTISSQRNWITKLLQHGSVSSCKLYFEAQQSAANGRTLVEFIYKARFCTNTFIINCRIKSMYVNFLLMEWCIDVPVN